MATPIKRNAEEHLEQRPAQLLRTELQGTVRPRKFQVNYRSKRPSSEHSNEYVEEIYMPANPKFLNDLLDIPDMYRNMLSGEQFLLYDSRTDGPDQSF